MNGISSQMDSTVGLENVAQNFQLFHIHTALLNNMLLSIRCVSWLNLPLLSFQPQYFRCGGGDC